MLVHPRTHGACSCPDTAHAKTHPCSEPLGFKRALTYTHSRADPLVVRLNRARPPAPTHSSSDALVVSPSQIKSHPRSDPLVLRPAYIPYSFAFRPNPRAPSTGTRSRRVTQTLSLSLSLHRAGMLHVQTLGQNPPQSDSDWGRFVLMFVKQHKSC